jgi:hypothetical protein
VRRNPKYAKELVSTFYPEVKTLYDAFQCVPLRARRFRGRMYLLCRLPHQSFMQTTPFTRFLSAGAVCV